MSQICMSSIYLRNRAYVVVIVVAIAIESNETERNVSIVRNDNLRLAVT
jgi:hypothetical protein